MPSTLRWVSPMPMGIEPLMQKLTRRAALQSLGLSALTLLPLGSALAATASHTTRKRPSGQRFAACWDNPQSQHFAGWLQLDASGQLTTLHQLELPTRGHGLALLPDGSLLVAARRPGDWLIRLTPGQPAQWLWQASDRVFSGHVLVSADGLRIYTTEIDTNNGQGLLGVRDARSLQLQAEHKTFGLDPHAVLGLPATQSIAKTHPLAGMLFVANGGIDTSIETGRVKRQLQQMDPSICCLHPDTGERLGQWRLPDPRLSLRHLAWALPDPSQASSTPTLGIALQAEHDDPALKAAAPLLARLSWADQAEGALSLATGQPALAGYGGDVTVAGRGPQAQFLVSATRGQVVARYALDGQYLGSTPLAEAGALAVDASSVWVGGRAGVMRVATGAEVNQANTTLPGHLHPWANGRVDNHWLHV